MKLKIDLAEFETQVVELVSKFELVQALEVTTQEALEQGQSTFMQICKAAEALLGTHISPADNEFFLSFKEQESFYKNTDKDSQTLEMLVKRLLNKVKDKKTDIQRIYKIISVSDVMLNKLSEEEVKARELFSIRDKKSLILEKLFELNDGWYYSIRSICIGNNIDSARVDEFLGLSKSLEKDNMIKIFRANHEDVLARLTIQGQEYVEEVVVKRLKVEKAVSTVKNDLGYDSSDVNLTEIKNNLKELISKNNYNEVLDKLDIIISGDCDIRNDLLMMMGRCESIESKRRSGLFSDAEFLIVENKIRYDIISIIDSLNNSIVVK